jgi:hypothetical protein
MVKRLPKSFFLCGMIKKTVALLFAAAAMNSCKPDLDVPTPSTGNADMSRMIAVGDNYMAGYQDGALYNKGQRLSIPALIAKQVPSSQAFVLPLMPDDNGIGIYANPYSIDYVTKSRLGYKTDCKGETSIAPVKGIVPAISALGYFAQVSSNVSNFSAPYLTVKDYFNPAAGAEAGNKFYHRFASSPGTSTIYSDAKAANATFFTAWIGMADIYEYARHGGVKPGQFEVNPCNPLDTASKIPVKDTIISASEFSLYLDSMLRGLTANGAKGAIATIPEIESFPFYTLIPWNGLKLDAEQAADLNQTTSNFFGFVEGENGFVAVDYSNCFVPFRKMAAGEFVLLNIPTDSLKCGHMGSFDGIPDVYVLDQNEANAIHQAVASFNAIISQKANQYNLALVDMNQFFKTIQAGIAWNGVDIDTEFISGGFFSLDGYHPNQKGYALIATEFIKAINAKYGATLSPVYCSECDGILFP